MAIKSKARHDLTLRSIKRELAAGRDVAFWLDKAYTHYDNGLTLTWPGPRPTTSCWGSTSSARPSPRTRPAPRRTSAQAWPPPAIPCFSMRSGAAASTMAVRTA